MEDKTYFSYLLRMWQIGRGNERVWLASLDEPHTGKRHSFTSLEKLFAFLQKQVQETDCLAEKEGEQSQPAQRRGRGRGTARASKRD